jgi:signal transduction histidine kinase
MSLKLRISLWVGGLLAGALILFAFAILWSEERSRAADLRRSQLTQAAGLAEVCRGAAVAENDLPLTNYLRALRESPEVREALCQDASGRVTGHTKVSHLNTKIEDASARRAMERPEPGMDIYEGTMEASAPIRVLGNPAGVARILYDESMVRWRLREDLARVRRRVLPLAVAVMGLGALGAFLLTSFVLKPLGQLVSGARDIGRGVLDRRISLKRRDELGLLAGEFDAMAEKLGELDRMKQDFVQGVTHDLKSPLATARAALDLINDRAGKDEGLVSPALRIRDSLDRLFHLITSLLDVARIESALDIVRRPVDLESLLERVVTSFELLARHKGLEIDLVLESALPEIRADEGKLERAFSNLVSNALKFTEKGHVRVRAAAREKRVEVSVEDTGPGMTPEAVAKLFTKFFRAARAPGAPKIEGAGLGLVIVKGFVEAHGGRIDVESKLGEGSLFRVSLPKGETA